MTEETSSEPESDTNTAESSNMTDVGIVVRGVLMGGADIIPGVSGGTIALIVGIYERLIRAISHVDRTFLKSLFSLQFKAAARHIDLRFLIALFLGIGIGIGGLASLMNYLLLNHTQYMMAVFFGLILASSHIVRQMIPDMTRRHLALLIVGILFAYNLVGIPALSQPPEGNGYFFLCGAVAISAMILPGISGAFILLLMGKYAEVTGIIPKIFDGTVSQTEGDAMISFGLGALFSLLAFSKFLRWLLANYETWTMAVLCGFMIGSLRKIWPFKIDMTPDVEKLKLKQFENILPDFTAVSSWVSLVLMVVAFASVLLLERWANNQDEV